MRHLQSNPDLEGPSGGPIVFELAEYLFRTRCQESQSASLPEEEFPNLVNALREDGFVVRDYRLSAMLPDVVPVAEYRDELSHLLETHDFGTATGHLRQAISAHTRGDWAAANAQLRAFIEALFDKIAIDLSEGHAANLATSHLRREWLASNEPPFFLSDLNEWDAENHGGFVEGFWRRLHPSGSHPGLSDEADSTFRLHMVILVGRHYLVRYAERLTPGAGGRGPA